MTYRMQIVLDDQSKRDLSWLMAHQNDSASGILRSLVIKEVKVKKKVQKRKPNAAQVMLETMREIKRLGLSKGPTDLSVNHDHYIYGWPKKQ